MTDKFYQKKYDKVTLKQQITADLQAKNSD
jgi:hypothetical protein